jgi:hypothetical protein
MDWILIVGVTSAYFFLFLQSMAHGSTLTATYAAVMQVRSLAERSSVK